jgi:hypothetical protein
MTLPIGLAEVVEHHVKPRSKEIAAIAMKGGIAVVVATVDHPATDATLRDLGRRGKESVFELELNPAAREALGNIPWLDRPPSELGAARILAWGIVQACVNFSPRDGYSIEPGSLGTPLT